MADMSIPLKKRPVEEPTSVSLPKKKQFVTVSVENYPELEEIEIMLEKARKVGMTKEQEVVRRENRGLQHIIDRIRKEIEEQSVNGNARRNSKDRSHSDGSRPATGILAKLEFSRLLLSAMEDVRNQEYKKLAALESDMKPSTSSDSGLDDVPVVEPMESLSVDSGAERDSRLEKAKELAESVTSVLLELKAAYLETQLSLNKVLLELSPMSNNFSQTAYEKAEKENADTRYYLDRYTEQRSQVDRLNLDPITAEHLSKLEFLRATMDKKKDEKLDDKNRLLISKGDLSVLCEELKMKTENLGTIQRFLKKHADSLAVKRDLKQRKSERSGKSVDDSVLLADIEIISDAYESVQTQESQLIKLLETKEASVAQLQMEKRQIEQELVKRERSFQAKLSNLGSDDLHGRFDRLLKSEMKLRGLIATLEQRTNSLVLEKQDEIQKQIQFDIDVLRRQALSKQLDVKLSFVKSFLDSRKADFSRHLSESDRLNNDLTGYKAKLDALEKYGSSAYSSHLSSELETLKQLIRCGTCNIHAKQVALQKCMHLFCKDCIDKRYESRQRKCPVCGEPFGIHDIKTIYL